MIETKNYSDGTSATGVAPLPDLSPEQQAGKRYCGAPRGWVRCRNMADDQTTGGYRPAEVIARDPRIDTRFQELDAAGRMVKIRHHVSTGHPVPAPWVEWLLQEFVNGKA